MVPLTADIMKLNEERMIQLLQSMVLYEAARYARYIHLLPPAFCSPFQTIIPQKGHNNLHSGQHRLMGQRQKTCSGYLRTLENLEN